MTEITISSDSDDEEADHEFTVTDEGGHFNEDDEFVERPPNLLLEFLGKKGDETGS